MQVAPCTAEALHVLDFNIYDSALVRIGEVSPAVPELDEIVRAAPPPAVRRAPCRKRPASAVGGTAAVPHAAGFPLRRDLPKDTQIDLSSSDDGRAPKK